METHFADFRHGAALRTIRGPFCAAFLAIAAGCGGLHGQSIDPLRLPETTISTSRQFVFSGNTRSVRAEYSRFFEELRAVWEESTGIRPSTSVPVLVSFPEDPRRRDRAPVTISPLQGDGGEFRLQMNVWDRELLNSPDLAAAVFQLLAVEASSRKSPPPANQALRFPPAWFVQAFVQQWQAKQRQPPLAMLEELMNSKRPPTATGILRQRNPPVGYAEASTFRLLSWALLRTLLEQPEGRNSLRAYIEEGTAIEWSNEKLLEKFPTLNTPPDALERQWVLTIAKFSHSEKVHLLGMRETITRTRSIFDISSELPIPRSKEKETLNGPLAMLGFATEEDGARQLMRLVPELLQLELRSHPMFTAVLREYRDIATQLARRPRSKLRKRIEANDELFASLVTYAESVEDAMNEYSINQPGSGDPLFREIFRTQFNSFETEQRTDAVSRALDIVEMRYRK